MTKVAYPSMRDHRYADTLAVGMIASSGPLGFLIPPFDQLPGPDTGSPTWSPNDIAKKTLALQPDSRRP